jgi:hypothetical protein
LERCEEKEGQIEGIEAAFVGEACGKKLFGSGVRGSSSLRGREMPRLKVVDKRRKMQKN